MNNRQARRAGWVMITCGCVLIVLSQLWLGLAFVAAGLGVIIVMGRCPHCGRMLFMTPPSKQCPRCRRPL